MENIGFSHKQTEAERLFAMMLDENNRLLTELVSTKKELIDTKQKLANANERLNSVGEQTSSNTEEIVETQIGLADTFECMETNSVSIVTCEEALAEVYEMLINIDSSAVDDAINDMFDSDESDANEFDDMFKEA